MKRRISSGPRPTVTTAKPRVNVSQIALEQLSASTRPRRPDFFKAAEHPPGVTPEKGKRLAMDEAWSGQGASPFGWANQQYISEAYFNGYMFLGYPELAILSQRAEYRKIVETIAFEMTRKWIKIRSKSDDDKSKIDKIKQIQERMKELNVQREFRRIAEQDGYFGRAHLYIDTGDSDNREELQKAIGDGSSALSKTKINKGGLKSLKTVEAVWCYPTKYDSNDPLSDTWYKPQMWYAQGKPIHITRLLTFVGREVADLLKPAYSFGGLSLSQMAKPYVDNWLRTRQSVAEIIHSFSVFVLSTNLATSLEGSGDILLRRAMLFNQLRDNTGLMLIDKETELFQNVSAPIGGLSDLQSQTQEHMAAVSGIPLVKLLGIQPAGLNASSEGELDCFETLINGAQENLFRPNLDTVFRFVQLDLWGEIDDDLVYDFEPLGVLSELEVANLRKIDAETDQILIDAGIIWAEESRDRIANDPNTNYSNLDVSDVPDLPEEGEEDGAGNKKPNASKTPSAKEENFSAKK